MGQWTEEERATFLDRKRKNRMAVIDSMPADLRALVNEYGLSVVQTCMDLGIQKPRHIRHRVQQILDELSPTRGAYSSQGIRSPIAHRPPIAALNEDRP